MTPHLKAYIVVFVVSVMALVFFRKPLADAVGARRADQWRNLWLVAISLLFLIPNFWLFIAALIVVVSVSARLDPLKPSIFLLLLFVAPVFGDAIPGFGGINKFIMVTPPLALSAVLLMPAMLSATKMKPVAKAGGATDMFFLAYLVLLMLLTMRAPSVTHMLRTALEEFLVMAPLYYVLSRQPKTLSDIKIMSAAYLCSILVLSVIAIPEFLRSWHLFTSASDQWFGARAFAYTLREGYLRTSTSVNDPIVWGTVTLTGIGIGLAFFNDKFSRFYKYIAFALIGFGLIVSFSRGPWLGAFVVVAVFVLISPKAPLRIAQFGGGGLVALLLAMATPFGQSVIDVLPFIGDSATSTIDYRQQLLQAAREVMAENPILGSQDYMQHPKLQALRQGQGIIDIVNTYIRIGLNSGFVGLFLFVGFFASALLALRGAMKSAQRYNPTLALYCRAYFATLVGVLVTIFTTSSVLHIPIIYWSLAGIAVALARIERHMRDNPEGVSTHDEEEPARPAFDWK